MKLSLEDKKKLVDELIGDNRDATLKDFQQAVSEIEEESTLIEESLINHNE